jgi:hypothetical protein
MVPLRFVSEASGAKVNWDGENKIVTIDSTGGNNIGTSVEDKVLEIREKFKNTNAETDYSICYFAGMDLSGNVYTDNKTGKVRKVIVDELYTRDDDYLVEMYVDNGKVYFVYEIYTNTQTNEKKEYRFYIDNNKLIRYIGPDGVVQDGLDTEEYRQAENSVFNNMIRYYWKYAFNEEY